jgi:hypothetical protein
MVQTHELHQAHTNNHVYLFFAPHNMACTLNPDLKITSTSRRRILLGLLNPNPQHPKPNKSEIIQSLLPIKPATLPPEINNNTPATTSTVITETATWYLCSRDAFPYDELEPDEPHPGSFYDWRDTVRETRAVVPASCRTEVAPKPAKVTWIEMEDLSAGPSTRAPDGSATGQRGNVERVLGSRPAFYRLETCGALMESEGSETEGRGAGLSMVSGSVDPVGCWFVDVDLSDESEDVDLSDGSEDVDLNDDSEDVDLSDDSEDVDSDDAFDDCKIRESDEGRSKKKGGFWRGVKQVLQVVDRVVGVKRR